MKEMKTFEPNLLDNKTMHGVYYNEYCLCRKLSNNSPEQLLILMHEVKHSRYYGRLHRLHLPPTAAERQS